MNRPTQTTPVYVSCLALFSVDAMQKQFQDQLIEITENTERNGRPAT